MRLSLPVDLKEERGRARKEFAPGVRDDGADPSNGVGGGDP
jgi:hypothetical protein